jgi:hypothetical protein
MEFRKLVAAAMLAAAVSNANASEAEDWAMLSRILSLAQGFLQISAEAPAGDQAQTAQALEAMLSGRNADANALMSDMFAEMPPAVRGQLLSMARTAVTLSQRQMQAGAGEAADQTALQARKDLAGMGLGYFDSRQFLDAVRRGDLLAARLFLLGRGLDAGALNEAREAVSDGEMRRLLVDSTTRRPASPAMR